MINNTTPGTIANKMADNDKTADGGSDWDDGSYDDLGMDSRGETRANGVPRNSLQTVENSCTLMHAPAPPCTLLHPHFPSCVVMHAPVPSGTIPHPPAPSRPLPHRPIP